MFLMNPKKKTKAIQDSPEKSKLEFLNLELDETKTRIVQLESNIEDKENNIKILSTIMSKFSFLSMP